MAAGAQPTGEGYQCLCPHARLRTKHLHTVLSPRLEPHSPQNPQPPWAHPGGEGFHFTFALPLAGCNAAATHPTGTSPRTTGCSCYTKPLTCRGIQAEHSYSHHSSVSQPAALAKRAWRCEAPSSVSTRRPINQQALSAGHRAAQSFPQHRAHSCSSDSSASHGGESGGNVSHHRTPPRPYEDTEPLGAAPPAAAQHSIATAARANRFPVTGRTSPMSQPHSHTAEAAAGPATSAGTTWGPL